MNLLTAEAEKRLKSFPPEYLDKAIEAVKLGKAFCPSCHWAIMTNCGYFDECAAYVMPDGSWATTTSAPATAQSGDR